MSNDAKPEGEKWRTGTRGCSHAGKQSWNTDKERQLTIDTAPIPSNTRISISPIPQLQSPITESKISENVIHHHQVFKMTPSDEEDEKPDIMMALEGSAWTTFAQFREGAEEAMDWICQNSWRHLQFLKPPKETQIPRHRSVELFHQIDINGTAPWWEEFTSYCVEQAFGNAARKNSVKISVHTRQKIE